MKKEQGKRLANTQIERSTKERLERHNYKIE